VSATNTDPDLPAGGAGPDAELARLAAEINDDIRNGDKARAEQLRRYRSAGEGLNRAKDLVGHGRFGAWLAEHCALSERQAQKYMKFAKSAPGADLDEEEALWREASGKGGRADEPTAEPDEEPSPPTPTPSAPTPVVASPNGDGTERRVSEGKSAGRRKRSAPPDDTGVEDDGSREFVFILPKEVADEMDEKVAALKEAWGTDDNATTVVRAVRECHRRQTGYFQGRPVTDEGVVTVTDREDGR
jgi:hypothetical protein